jgi:hypothetical protein
MNTTDTKDYGYLIHVGPGIAASNSQLPLSMHPEKVTVRERGWPNVGDWEAFYEGRWRKVHMQKDRAFIVYLGKRIAIEIDWVTP